MALGGFASLLIIAAGGALIYGIVFDPAVAGPVAGAVGVIGIAVVSASMGKEAGTGTGASRTNGAYL
jgi:hypothetical protein